MIFAKKGSTLTTPVRARRQRVAVAPSKEQESRERKRVASTHNFERSRDKRNRRLQRLPKTAPILVLQPGNVLCPPSVHAVPGKASRLRVRGDSPLDRRYGKSRSPGSWSCPHRRRGRRSNAVKRQKPPGLFGKRWTAVRAIQCFTSAPAGPLTPSPGPFPRLPPSTPPRRRVVLPSGRTPPRRGGPREPRPLFHQPHEEGRRTSPAQHPYLRRHQEHRKNQPPIYPARHKDTTPLFARSTRTQHNTPFDPAQPRGDQPTGRP